MRYDEYREHVRAYFQNALVAFKERVAVDGPPTEPALEAIHNSLSLDRADLLDAMSAGYPDGEAGVLRAFLERRGVAADVPPEKRDLFLREYLAGHQAYLRNATEHLRTLTDFDLAEPLGALATAHPSATVAPATPEPAAFSEAAQCYLDEGRRSNQWVPKTLASKVEDLKLLGELTGQIPLAAMTKADARAVKDKLLRLPKNRNKMPRTRNMPLAEALTLTDVEVISTQTVNG